MWLLVRRDWRGAVSLPRGRGYIAAVNHLSVLDPFVYGHFQYGNGHPRAASLQQGRAVRGDPA